MAPLASGSLATGGLRRRIRNNPHEPVDSSASAIAAQGLIRLGRHLGVSQGKRYTQAGLTLSATSVR